MTKREAQSVARTMEQAGMAEVALRSWPQRKYTFWDVTAVDPQTGTRFSVESAEQWSEIVDRSREWAV